MQRQIYEVTRDRFSLKDKNVYILQGTWPEDYKAEAWLDSRQLKTEMKDQERVSALEKFKDRDLVGGCRKQITVYFPEDLSGYRKLTVYASADGRRRPWYTTNVERLRRIQNRIQYFLEDVIISEENKCCRIRGWSAYSSPVRVRVEDASGHPIDCEVEYQNRVDVQKQFDEITLPEKTGFFVEIPYERRTQIFLIFETKGQRVRRKVYLQKWRRIEEKLNDYWKKGVRYWRLYGVGGLAAKCGDKIKNYHLRPIPYDKWIEKHLPSKSDLEMQRRHSFKYSPKISIVVPLYRTPEKYLLQLVESVQQQTYRNWELCLSDGSGSDSPLKEILSSLETQDTRIRVVRNAEPLQISENTNQAIRAASGDFIAFADHDDKLTPDALYECVKALNEHPELEVLYSDEDKMTMDGKKYFQPHFKPQYNIDLLCTVNYICHLFVVKRSVIEQVGMLRSEFDGAQDYDFIFRCTEYAGRDKIYRIPRILYHWRSHEESTAENPESKRYAFEAGRRAIEAHYQRSGIEAEVFPGEYMGLYRTRYRRAYDPLISVIIPNKDHTDDLERCLRSLEKVNTYQNMEYLIIENNSEKEETFAYYRKLEEENPKARVIYWDGVFNYSAINNFGVQHAKGEYLLLLNNDTEIINKDCIEELLGYAMRPDVGAVGARLYFEDDTIQHAGVVIGFGGVAGHCFVQQKRNETGYCHRIICAQDYSAVTAACMMVKREAFEKAGGLSEALQVAFNDIDFCLKLQRVGYLVVYNPYAELYHYESKSRGLEDTPEKIARFNREIAVFEKRWPEILKNGDPYYNPNLTLDSQDFSLKRI